MNIIPSKRITPRVYSDLELTKLKRIDNVEDIFLCKLDQLFQKNSNVRYSLIRFLKANLDTVTPDQIVRKLKEWNIEVEYNIESISIQRILNYIK